MRSERQTPGPSPRPRSLHGLDAVGAEDRGEGGVGTTSVAPAHHVADVQSVPFLGTAPRHLTYSSYQKGKRIVVVLKEGVADLTSVVSAILQRTK